MITNRTRAALRPAAVVLAAASLVFGLTACSVDVNSPGSNKTASADESATTSSRPSNAAEGQAGADGRDVDVDVTSDANMDNPSEVTSPGADQDSRCAGRLVITESNSTHRDLGACGDLVIEGHNVTVSAASFTSVTINGSNDAVVSQSTGPVTITGHNNTVTGAVGFTVNDSGSNNTVS